MRFAVAEMDRVIQWKSMDYPGLKQQVADTGKQEQGGKPESHLFFKTVRHKDKKGNDQASGRLEPSWNVKAGDDAGYYGEGKGNDRTEYDFFRYWGHTCNYLKKC